LQTNEIALRDTSLAISEAVKNGASIDDLKRMIMLWSKSFENRQEINSSFLGIYAYFDGHFLSGVGWVAPADYKPESRPWYKGAVEKKGEIYYTEPYVDAMTKKVIGTISRTIYDEKGKMLCVICVDFYLHPVVEMVRAVNISGAGFGIIMDSSHRIISHPNDDLEGKNLSELPNYSKVHESLRADFDTSAIHFTGSLSPGASSEKLIGFFSRMFNGWYVGTVVPTQYFYKDIYTMLPILIAFSVSFMLVLCVLLIRLSMGKMRSDEANKSKSAFLARMSHEIRTPMNAVIGMSELALRIDGMPRLASEYILGIKQAGQNLLSIINDILDFSRIESDNLDITPLPYILSSVLNDVVNVIRVRVSEKPVFFTANIDAKIPGNLIGDETRVRQIMLNLLSNAAKYTSEGYITLSVSAKQAGDGRIILCIEVEDSGIGIKPEDLEGLFGTFVRVDSEHNKGVEGTGLGLSITKSLCHAMGGEVTVSSEYGKGSVFTATIYQMVESDVPMAAVENAAEKSVLFYDERSFYAESIFITLTNLGVPVTVTTEPEAFFSRLESEKFKFAFVSRDIVSEAAAFIKKMKLPTSLVLLANLGELSSFQDIPTITMPAYSVPVANALNYTISSDSKDMSGARFTAPEASVLLVDDILTNLIVAKGLLAPYGMRIDTCESGRESIELVTENSYDIVFMDHMMPGMDGIEATGILRGTEKGRGLPIVALTANAVTGMRDLFIASGMNDYLSKPIEPAKLDAILYKWIPKDKQLRRTEKGDAPETSAARPPEIAGVDTASGMAMVGGSMPSYMEVLGIYCRDVLSRMDFLRKFADNIYEAGETNEDALRDFTTQVHALKSASANVGAAEISRLAADLESASRSADFAFIKANLASFTDGLETLEARIRTAAAQSRPSEGARGSGREDLKRLVCALEAEDEMDIDVLDEILDSLLASGIAADETTREKLTGISEMVLMSEFKNALAAARELEGQVDL
jgi:signal transduction histidine kinase/CheY-like chemotaxis protein